MIIHIATEKFLLLIVFKNSKSHLFYNLYKYHRRIYSMMKYPIIFYSIFIYIYLFLFKYIFLS